MAEQWFRLWHGTVTDPKFGIVARDCHAMSHIVTQRHAVLSVWLYLLETASQNSPRGSVEGLDVSVMAYALDMDDDMAQAIIEAMRKRGLIEDNFLNGWEKRQPSREDPGAADRKRASRMSHNVTQCHAASHNVPLDKIREEEIREDKKDQEQRRSPKGSRLPADWSLTPEYRQAATETRPDWNDQHTERVADSFRDYWISQPGAKGLKLDWLATWRNWCRNYRTPVSQAAQPQQTRQRIMLADKLRGGAV